MNIIERRHSSTIGIQPKRVGDSIIKPEQPLNSLSEGWRSFPLFLPHFMSFVG